MRKAKNDKMKSSIGSFQNPRRVGFGKNSKAVQPHNYRLYFDFKKEGYNPTQPYSQKNHRSEHHYTFSTHRIIIRKKSAEIQYLAHKKQWRRVISDSEEGISAKIDQIDKEIEEKCYSYMIDFLKKNGGKSELTLLRKRKQDWGIHGDSFLDTIDPELIITDTVFKKHYDRKVELYDANEVKNYISNRALERFSPDIADNLKKIDNKIEMIKEILEASYTLEMLKRKIKNIGDVFQFKEQIKNLTDKEMLDLSIWMIERFGV